MKLILDQINWMMDRINLITDNSLRIVYRRKNAFMLFFSRITVELVLNTKIPPSMINVILFQRIMPQDMLLTDVGTDIVKSIVIQNYMHCSALNHHNLSKKNSTI